MNDVGSDCKILVSFICLYSLVQTLKKTKIVSELQINSELQAEITRLLCFVRMFLCMKKVDIYLQFVCPFYGLPWVFLYKTTLVFTDIF